MAQSYLDDRASQIDQRIDEGLRDGSLTYSEARTLRSQLRYDQRLQSEYQDEGMSNWQARDLNRRYDELSNNLYSMRSNTEYRYRRWNGWW